MSHPNTQLQSSTIDILQSLVARGDVDLAALLSAESIVVDKLYSCIHLGSLDLQNKLLHLLHSIISAFRARTDTSNNGQQKLDDQRGTESTVNINSLLVQTLVDGLSVSSNRPILQHWLDFILTTIPQFHEILQPAIGPLNDCVCRLLQSGLEEITQASSQSSTAGDISVIATDADFLMLLNALERLVLLSLSQLPDTTQVDDDVLSEKPTTEGTSILGYVSNVFSTEPTSGLTEEQMPVSSVFI
ncbi:hypothetical protein PHLCEN_2v2840 [Hermanssonia centrifuga]|uniref:Uncharacterized protein n=1 Tax=Hermanssonia centrifuga TaxID=98765 RepID=A0A2R6RI37_9APHY|nr:hypothetical protein PHLCEN_2v2840 [Hermanssonia centrifuga]